jgi:hypothetical protein
MEDVYVFKSATGIIKRLQVCLRSSTYLYDVMTLEFTKVCPVMSVTMLLLLLLPGACIVAPA